MFDMPLRPDYSPDDPRDTYRYGDIEEYDKLLADLADAAEMAEEVFGTLADLAGLWVFHDMVEDTEELPEETADEGA